MIFTNNSLYDNILNVPRKISSHQSKTLLQIVDMFETNAW